MERPTIILEKAPYIHSLGNLSIELTITFVSIELREQSSSILTDLSIN